MTEDYSIKMASTNEEIAPPKPKTSPLEFRNTDLVSRLLAATPPYLYNMPLVPHSYFFSEMLRSLVQGKTEAARMQQSTIPHRRSRKRTWSHGRNEQYVGKQQMSPGMKCDSTDMPPPNWTPKVNDKSGEMFEGSNKISERPLELTMNKIPLNNNNTKLCHTETHPSSEELASHKVGSDKQDLHQNQIPSLNNGHVPLPFPPLSTLSNQEANTTSSDLILPPPPPIWYPPLYPTPYGIDPLHFFIDLRVSGHIYDRKNSKDQQQHPNLSPHHSINHMMESSTNSPITSSTSSLPENSFNLIKQPRHASAFSVPTPSISRNDPLNLSGNKYHSQQKMGRFNSDEKPAKFDIKSMGFDNVNTDNIKSTNYILKNLPRIYKGIQTMKQDSEGIDLTSAKHEYPEHKDEDVNVKDELDDDKEGESSKGNKCKDLRALIGLELVVDYVKHERPGKQSGSEDNFTDVESNVSSPAVEVVTVVPDLENKINV